MKTCLDQCCQQSACFELHDPGWHSLGSTRNKVVRVAEIRNFERAGWSHLRCDGAGDRIHSEVGFQLEVVDYWTKLAIAAGSTEEFYATPVIERPVMLERLTAGTPYHVFTIYHQFFE